MDFGFGSFLEAFERHAGKHATRLLVLLMGLAVAVTCAGLIWSGAIRPLIEALLPLTRDIRFWTITANVAFLAGSAVLGSALGSWILSSFARWREARAYRDATRRIEALMGESRERHHAHMARLDEMIERVEKLDSQSSELNREFVDFIGAAIETIDGAQPEMSPQMEGRLDNLKKLTRELRETAKLK